jgi:hypothetical protein
MCVAKARSSAAASDQKTLERALDRGGIAGAPERVGRVDARARVLPGELVLVVEDVGRDLDERRTGRRAHRLAEGEAQVDADRRPVEDALREARERPADLGAVRLLERAERVLRRGVLAGDADDGAPGEAGDAEAGDGVREPAARRDGEHAGAAEGAGVGVGGVGARLLVPHVDHRHVVVPEVRQDRPDVAAVHREEVADALLREDAADDRAAVDARGLARGRRLAEGFAHGAHAVHGAGLYQRMRRGRQRARASRGTPPFHARVGLRPET